MTPDVMPHLKAENLIPGRGRMQHRVRLYIQLPVRYCHHTAVCWSLLKHNSV